MDRHRRVTLALVLTGLVLALGGGLSYHLQWLAWPTLVAALVAFAIEWFLARRAGAAPAVRGQ